MTNTRTFCLGLIAVLAAQATSSHAIECRMALAFQQKDDNAKSGLTAVWADQQATSLMFIDRLNINTDGTRRSYSVSDFWGEKDALNNLCNAMSDACAGMSSDALKQRRLITQDAAAKGWPSAQLAQSRISPSIIPFKGGKPCPPVNGFLVSATALHKPQVSDVCDIGNYVDALQTPAIVIPRDPAKNVPSDFRIRNAKVGDLVVTLRRDLMQPVFAVVGDTGPVGKLGEGSIALNGQLLGKTAPPINYQELRGKGVFKGKGWTAPPTIVIIFPGTRNETDPWMSPERINSAALDRFEAWGGLARAKACAATYPM